MEQLTFSVVIPVWNGAAHLSSCLRALTASERQPNEITVVDDSSTDESASIAQTYGVKVLRLTNGPFGPATARNRGVAASSGDVIVFVDCDVAVHPDTIGKIEKEFLADSEICGVFGSYDDQPKESDLVSRYRNLLHHHVHQQSRCEASTFWAGCGAIRREAFESQNGFDETYRWASIEDIELGLRLTSAGHRFLLRRDIQATHGKRWTLSEVIYTDIFRRAVPWTRLLLKENSLPNDLNLRIENRLSAAAVWTLLILLPLVLSSPQLFFGMLVPLGVLFACNWSLYRLFFRCGGFYFSLGAIALHWLHYLYSSATFLILTASSLVRSERAPYPARGLAADHTAAVSEAN